MTAAAQAQARDLTVTSWGGSYQDAQRKVFFEPFTQATGIKLVEDSWDGGIGAVARQGRGRADLGPGPGRGRRAGARLRRGHHRADRLQPRSAARRRSCRRRVHECGVGAIVWGTVLAYDGDKIKDDGPQSWADFFDTKKFPGKRALRKGPRQALEFALMADGVPLDQIYATLKTPEGVDRAFKKLDSIKATWCSGRPAPSRRSSWARARW